MFSLVHIEHHITLDPSTEDPLRNLSYAEMTHCYINPDIHLVGETLTQLVTSSSFCPPECFHAAVGVAFTG